MKFYTNKLFFIGSVYGKTMIEKVEKVFNLSRIAVVIPKKIAPYVSVYKEWLIYQLNIGEKKNL